MTRSATRRTCRKRSPARASRLTLREVRGGLSREDAPCSRCSRAPRKIFRRAASRNISRWLKCPTLIARVRMSRQSVRTRNSRRPRWSRILKSEGNATSVDNIDASDPVPIIDGTARAPWRWERLLVDAAVIGSAQRWKKRLAGLGNELRARRAEIADDDARAAGLERQILDLAHLGEVAMPILSMLDAAPRDATWGDWLKFLRALVELAIRDREPVLAALAELEPMAPVGPVGLDEVRLVLNDRLGRLEAPRRVRRYGAVFVAPPSRARGMEFDVVIVPGLAERMFPRKLTEDPILSDSARARLSPYLARIERRVGAERLALRIAAGAARERAMFSYSRVDLDQGRPRVPSFYALEILRAAEGRLPGFDELAGSRGVAAGDNGTAFVAGAGESGRRDR